MMKLDCVCLNTRSSATHTLSYTSSNLHFCLVSASGDSLVWRPKAKTFTLPLFCSRFGAKFPLTEKERHERDVTTFNFALPTLAVLCMISCHDTRVLVVLSERYTFQCSVSSGNINVVFHFVSSINTVTDHLSVFEANSNVYKKII